MNDMTFIADASSHGGDLRPFMIEAVQPHPGVVLDIDFSTRIVDFPTLYNAVYGRELRDRRWDLQFHRDVMKDVFARLLSFPVIASDNVSMCILDETLSRSKTPQSLGSIAPVVEYLWFEKGIASIAGLIPSKIHQNRRCDFANLDDRLVQLAKSRLFGVRIPLYLTDMIYANDAFCSLDPHVDACFSSGLTPFIHINLPQNINADQHIRFISHIEEWLDMLENERQRIMFSFSAVDCELDYQPLTYHPNVIGLWVHDAGAVTSHDGWMENQVDARCILMPQWLSLFQHRCANNEQLFKKIQRLHRGRAVLHR